MVESIVAPLRTGKTTTVGFGLQVRNGNGVDGNGVGSHFRATTSHMEDAFSENDSRPFRICTRLAIRFASDGVNLLAIGMWREHFAPERC
jgi:hypothetical protein